ncbi:MAG TPA: hypothetical protein VL859_02245, partial [Flavobacterium sp.]|nr:hypothetical protein [Flavobacterium sp.]
MKKYTLASLIGAFLFLLFTNCNQNKSNTGEATPQDSTAIKTEPVKKKPITTIDTADYNRRMIALSNKDTTGMWPVKAPYPLPGALLPYHRIIAFYGNLYSKRMGVLGE